MTGAMHCVSLSPLWSGSKRVFHCNHHGLEAEFGHQAALIQQVLEPLALVLRDVLQEVYQLGITVESVLR